jgi:hypothetical protein
MNKKFINSGCNGGDYVESLKFVMEKGLSQNPGHRFLSDTKMLGDCQDLDTYDNVIIDSPFKKLIQKKKIRGFKRIDN